MQEHSLESCIQICWQARHACQKTLFEHCLVKGGDHVAPTHVQLMTDCMEICQTAADFMTRGSPLHTSVCAAAANVLEACADSCEAITCNGSQTCPEMQRTADICRIAANSCRTAGQEGILHQPEVEMLRPQA
jgi:hypothetical protein